MKPERLLLPVDIARCPLEVMELVNGFASRPEVTIILLHVLNSVGAPSRFMAKPPRPSRERALWYLARLAKKYIHPIASTITRVRSGDVAEQILEEARIGNADLIILPTYRPSLWDSLRALWRAGYKAFTSPLAERLIKEANCSVFLVGAKTRFNCERAWGLPAREELAAVC